MENLTTQSSKFNLSTSNSFKMVDERLHKSGLVPQINFNLPIDSNVFLKLIDTNGTVVKVLINGEFLRRGQYSNEILLNNLIPGDYYFVIESDGLKEVRAIRVFESNHQ